MCISLIRILKTQILFKSETNTTLLDAGESYLTQTIINDINMTEEASDGAAR